MRGCMASDLLPEIPRVRRELQRQRSSWRPAHRLRAPLTIDERLRAAGLPPLTRPMWLEIDVAALVGNVAAIREACRRRGRPSGPWSRQTATATAWRWLPGRSWRVAPTGCAWRHWTRRMALRAAGIEGPVLILYPVPADTAEDAARQGFQLAVSTLEGATALADQWVESGAAASRGPAAAPPRGRDRPGQDGCRAVRDRDGHGASRVPGISVAAVWSHLATPDDARMSSDQEQHLADAVRLRGPGCRRTHPSATSPRPVGCSPGAVWARPWSVPASSPTGSHPTPDAPSLPGVRPAMRLVARAMRIVTVPDRDARWLRRDLGRRPRVTHRDPARGLRRRLRPFPVRGTGPGPGARVRRSWGSWPWTR